MIVFDAFQETIMDKFLAINAVFVTLALVVGLYSRSLPAALVAGIWIALLQSGLVLLAMGQAAVGTVTEIAPLSNLVDAAMQSGYAGFAYARIVAYLVVTAIILLAVCLAAFGFRWVVANIFGLVLPQKASA
jgi:hypothetical protein